jgi:hypothetical protein
LSETPGSGVLNVEETIAAITALRPPLQKSEIEALVASIERDGKVQYVCAAVKLKCYGGGLQELVAKGLDRQLIAHSQVGSVVLGLQLVIFYILILYYIIYIIYIIYVNI